MSKNLQTVTKWLPLEIKEFLNLFEECRDIEKSISILLQRLWILLDNFKKKLIKNELQLQELEDISLTITTMDRKLRIILNKLNLNNPYELINNKLNFWKIKIRKIQLKLLYTIQDLIKETICLFIEFGDNYLVIILKIITSFNNMLSRDIMTTENWNVSSNTCPYLMFPLKKISMTKLLQIISHNRAEMCCHKLIDCLLETYTLENDQENYDSDNSSTEIYKALTKHMSPVSCKNDDNPEQTTILQTNYQNIDEMMRDEEMHISNLLLIILKTIPELLGPGGVKKSRNSRKINPKTQDKIVKYYQEILWGEVGAYLEHIILWWTSSPLSARPPHSTQNLREWINQFTTLAPIPRVIIGSLSNLSDGLGVFVTSTSWDQYFRVALVQSHTPKPDTGKLFADLLQDLVELSNQCEVTVEWVVGAPLEELPLVEQIPILHRLDHSIHTTRLWVINEAKKLSNTWNVHEFFQLTQHIVDCLSRLESLKLNDHTIQIEKGGLGVHVEVCALMRAKLTSEVTVNIQNLKSTQKESLDILAKVCRTYSLAHLQMIFPNGSHWKKTGRNPPNKPTSYVEKYLEQVLVPLLSSTTDPFITNTILRIMCECLLDHIYTNRIKFSRFGAIQLLHDFDHIKIWLKNCQYINEEMRQKMLQNEVLRRCEGVGRLLLRRPGEQIKMTEKIATNKENKEQTENAKGEMMPAEMYVPNQEQWLALRAEQRRRCFRICCGNGCC